ncbi:MAG: UDP-2,3-diacylglucosamine diphosphatase LpxI [Candidatus Binatia bacterium]
MTETIGLIAGNGRFPLIFAEIAKREGVRVVAVAHRGETDEAIDGVADAVTWVRVGELGKMIRAFRDGGVRRAVMAGGLSKASVFRGGLPDLRGAMFLARMRSFRDDALLRAVAAEFESDGIAIVPSTTFLSSIVVHDGVLGRHSPRRRQWSDIAYGFRLAKEVGRFDVGQSVVIKGGVALAVEGMEGTDPCIRRGAELGHGEVVVVKVSKPGQDLRFDVPAVGPRTIETMAATRAHVLALEAERTILLDRDELVERADRAGIVVVGVSEATLAERAE